MDQESTFRQAVPREAPLIMQIIRQAQARMRAAGSSQWQDGYPAPGHISADIGRGCGYVLCRPGGRECRAIIAYGAVAFDGEPAYEALEGEWLTDGPYVVVHRMAVADGECGKGVAAEFLRQAEEMARIHLLRKGRLPERRTAGVREEALSGKAPRAAITARCGAAKRAAGRATGRDRRPAAQTICRADRPVRDAR